MRESPSNLVRLSAGFLLLMLGVVATTAVAEEAAMVRFSATGIMFQPTVAADGFTLRVSCGEGMYFEKHYAGTEEVSFAPAGRDGSPVMDGQCKYELRSHVSVDRDAVEAAEAAGDDQRVQQLWQAAWQQSRVTSGSFEVVGGLLVAPVLEGKSFNGDD